jgi:flagellar motor switch protein FliG
MMEQKIQKVVEEIQKASHISESEKPAIIKKIEEWREEKDAISDLTNTLEEWWLKVEPIFAEIGLV